MSSFADALAHVRQQQPPQQPSGAAPDFSDALAQVRQQHVAGGSWTPAPEAQTDTAADVLRLYAPGFVAAHPTIASGIGAVGDALQGGGRTLIDQGIRLAKYISPRGGAALQRVAGDYATPIPGAAETVGRLGTQAAEFAIPGAAEEQGAARIGEALERAPAIVRGAAKLIPSAASGAGITALQGGSPVAGALVGGGAEAIGNAAHALAPSLTGGALGIRRIDRAYGKTPERAILDYTSGIRPATVAGSARNAINGLTGDIDRIAAAGTQPVSMVPGRDVLAARIARVPRNAPSELAANQAVMDNLSAFPATVSPAQALEASRGLRKEFGKFGREPGFDSSTASNAAKEATHAIGGELNRSLGPEFASKNQAIASLIAAERRAKSLANGPGVAERIGHRIAAHTGVLGGGALAGGLLGYERGGAKGAALGGALGLALPELVSSPAARMAMARTAERFPSVVKVGKLPALAAASALTRGNPK